ncbi:MAG: Amuc_1099 family pilus-like system protein [Chthoniobacterales bacterium]
MGGHTNPTEKESHPPYTSMLKLKSFTQEQFPLIFTSTVEDTYAINNIDRSKPTQFLKVGDVVQGTRYKITGYTEKFDTDRYGTRVDVSELALEQVDTHDKITLVKEKTAISPEAVATFLYTWGQTDQTFSVKKDQEFTLKPFEQIKYKLLDVQPDKAIINNSQSPNEKIEIPLLKP